MDISNFLEQCQIKKIDTAEYSPLILAYMGDAVFEICVRSMAVSMKNQQVNKLHKISREFVKAQTQAKLYFLILDELDENELAILKRGRNAKSFTTAKNASVKDYRHATGLECLFGYLYLKGNNQRIMELFEICVKRLGENLDG